MRFVALGTALLTLWTATAGTAHAQWPDEYDGYFIKYSKRYFGAHFDWRWFKAQAIAESNLLPGAVSHVGAEGIMQIMPTTYEEIKAKNPHFGDMNSARWNIAAGIYYNRMLFRNWNRKIVEQERLYLTFASYNAGLGRIQQAYRNAPPPVRAWNDIAEKAPHETRQYVNRIRGLRSNENTRLALSSKGISGQLAGQP